MGLLEKSALRERRWGAFQKGMLAAVAVGGIVLIGATVPNAARLLKYFPGRKSGARFTYQAKSALARLAAKGSVVFVEKNGKKYAQITPKGERELELAIEGAKVHKKRRWDRRWRVVAFDIPDKRKHVRNRLRRLMIELEFVRLQDSVWIYPYDCEDLIALAKTEMRLGTDVLYMLVERLERDEPLRRHFNLPLE